MKAVKNYIIVSCTDKSNNCKYINIFYLRTKYFLKWYAEIELGYISYVTGISSVGTWLESSGADRHKSDDAAATAHFETR